MTSQRWIIARRLVLVLLLGTGAAVAARKGKQAEEETPPTPVVEETPPAPALPAAAPLFPAGLPAATGPVPDGLPSLSAQGCNACHWDAHDAWAAGPHARAWDAPAFREALERIGNPTACTGCHLPLDSQHARLAAGYAEGDLARPDLQPNPGWDPTLMSEGVTCAACHVRDGAVLTTRADADAPHPLALSEELGTSELCATCHQLTWPEADRPFYDTYGEWRASAYAAAGIGCADCHMPAVPAQATATRFAAVADHAFPAEPGRALSILVRTGAPEVQRGTPFDVAVDLQNTGAGHHVPTGSPFKTWRVVLTLRGEDGTQLVAPHFHDLARRVEDAPPWSTLSDTRLAAGATERITHSFTVDQRKRAGRGTLQVAIYRLDQAAQADSRWSPDKAGPPLVQQQIPLPIL